jgi:diguanylate cyclase (GGDEF)-like protein
MLPDTDASEAIQISERLRHLIAEMRIVTSQGDLAITVSLGCATALPNQDLLSVADKALYAAKRAGRNRVYTMDSPPVAA